MISSPCIKKCLVDMEFQVCMGCGRTMMEIEDWEGFVEVDRLAIIERSASRVAYYHNKKVEKNTFDISRLVHNHK